VETANNDIHAALSCADTASGDCCVISIKAWRFPFKATTSSRQVAQDCCCSKAGVPIFMFWQDVVSQQSLDDYTALAESPPSIAVGDNNR
jgi:hypothetical protein